MPQRTLLGAQRGMVSPRGEPPPGVGGVHSTPPLLHALGGSSIIILAGRAAIKISGASQEIFDVAETMCALFGVGSGRVILRSVAAALGTGVRAVGNICGTRKVVYLSRAIGLNDSRSGALF